MRSSFLLAIALIVTPAAAHAAAALTVRSTAFENGATIPRDYTCDGRAQSPPPLEWSQVPRGTTSIAIVVDDPDAPRGVFAHWIVYNLPPDLRRAAPNVTRLDAGAVGENSGGKAGWYPPCPPSGTHHYRFSVYALDTMLELSTPTELQLDRAMQGHILAKGELVGTYAR